MHAEFAWLAAIILFAVLEGITSALVSVWFIGGAIGALIASLCGAELWLQAVIFVGISVVLLIALRPVSKKLLNKKKTAMNAEGNIGKIVLVTESVDNLRGTGAVKISGVEWSARSENDLPIEKETKVRVTRLEGSKVYVEPIE